MNIHLPALGCLICHLLHCTRQPDAQVKGIKVSDSMANVVNVSTLMAPSDYWFYIQVKPIHVTVLPQQVGLVCIIVMQRCCHACLSSRIQNGQQKIRRLSINCHLTAFLLSTR